MSMERQNRQLTILAIVLVVLMIAAVLWPESEEDKFADPDAPAERKLFEFERTGITKLSLANEHGELQFANAGGTWRMTSPREMAVEQSKVSEIVDRMAELDVQVEPLGGALTDYGLVAGGWARVVLADDKGTQYQLYVGRDAPVGWRSYVAEQETGPALLAGTRVSELVHRSSDDFRSKSAWTIAAGTAKRVKIQVGADTVVLRKDDHGWWLGDAGHRADKEAVERWLNQVSAWSFADFGDATFPGPAWASLTVEDADGTHELSLGAKDGDRFSVLGSEGRLGSEIEEEIHATGWEGKLLIPVRALSTEKVDVKLGGAAWNFSRVEGKWTDAAGKAMPGVQAFLDELTTLAADRTGTPPAALGAEWGRIVLTEGADKAVRVTIGEATAGGFRVVQDPVGGPLYRVTQAGLDVLAEKLAAADKEPPAGAAPSAGGGGPPMDFDFEKMMEEME
jgi:nitrogen fixation-related uncharacterized protein